MWDLLQYGKIRKAWKAAADNLNLNFRKSLVNSNLEIEGEIDGFNVNVRYDTLEAWGCGLDMNRPINYTMISLNSRGRIPSGLNMDHPENPLYRVSEGNVYFNNRMQSCETQTETILNAFGLGKGNDFSDIHITEPNELISHIQFMVYWAKELTES